MAVGTLVSRLTGFLRASLLAAAIGVSLQAEVFNVANTIPNSLYILVAGGVFNSVLVPQMVRALEGDPDRGAAYANRIITLGALVLAGTSVILVLAAPLMLRALVDGSYFTDPALAPQREALIVFARWCLPQIFFYGMYVLLGQILNARGRFGPMMWTPIANNVVAIAVISVYLWVCADEPPGGGYTTTQETLLGLGSTVGIAVQALLLLPYLARAGFRIRPRFDFAGTGLGHTLRLGMWTVGFVIVNQLAFYVLVHRATSGTAQVVHGATGASGFTVYSNAFLLTQVPHSIVTVSLATAMMPLVSSLAAHGRLSAVGSEVQHTLRLMLAVIVPCGLALLVVGPPLATILFSWGQATGDTASLGLTLIAFAPGTILFSVHYVALRGFYALEDTRTPFFIQCLIAGTNIVLAIALTVAVAPHLVAPVLAIAYGASYAVGALVSLTVLSRRVGHLNSNQLWRFVVRVTVAAAAAAAIAWLVVKGLHSVGLTEASKPDSLVILAACSLVGLSVYVLAARLLHIVEVDDIVMLVSSRRSRSAAHLDRTRDLP